MRRPAEVTKVTLPNIITIARLILVPTIVWLMISNEHVFAFWLFVLAGVGDSVDGFIARQFNLATKLGAYLDPLADKTLLVSIYVVMAAKAEVPVWLTIMIVSRDALIIGAFLLSWVMDRPVEVRPLLISKLNTFAQIVLAALILADLASADLGLAMTRNVMILIVAILTVSSAGAYLVGWARHTGRV